MPCYDPRTLYRPHDGSKPTFEKPKHKTSRAVEVPCNVCIGCKLDYERDWSVRMVHQARTSGAAEFVTLTYADENVPYGGHFVHEHFTKAIKHLRDANPDRQLKYFMTAEYQKNGNPHFHFALFGLPLDDKRYFKSENGRPYYTSETLEKAWQGRGFHLTAELNLKTAAYMARYMLKDTTTKNAPKHWVYVDREGRCHDRQAPYATMSTRPAIGREWFDRYAKSDIYQSDGMVHIDGKMFPPPRTYDRWYEQQDPEHFAVIQEEREQRSKELKARWERTRERRAVKEESKKLKLKAGKRRKSGVL